MTSGDGCVYRHVSRCSYFGDATKGGVENDNRQTTHDPPNARKLQRGLPSNLPLQTAGATFGIATQMSSNVIFLQQPILSMAAEENAIFMPIAASMRHLQ